MGLGLRGGGTVPGVGELLRLGRDEATVDRVVEALDTDGCVVVERYLDDAKVAALKDELAPYRETTPEGRNDFEGHSTRRVYALFAKVRGFDDVATDPLVLGVLDDVLGPSYQLSGPIGIDIGPGESPQGLHRDDVGVPRALAAPADRAQHDVGARRLHRRQRRDRHHPRAATAAHPRTCRRRRR